MTKEWIIAIFVAIFILVLMATRPIWGADQVDIVAQAHRSCAKSKLVLAPKSITAFAWVCTRFDLLHQYPKSKYYLLLNLREAMKWCRIVYGGKLIAFAPETNLFICEDGRRKRKKTKQEV